MSIEAMNQALEALELAACSHDVMLLTDPPQDAWKARSVTFRVVAAMQSLRAAIAEASKQDVQQEIEAPRVIKRYGHGVDEILLVEDTPPRREWVGLTDGDIAQACGFGEYTTSSTQQTLIAIARAIEAKLKEKNT